MFRKILLLLSGNVAISLVLFLRMILIARVISVADFGIASTFMISVTIMQLLSNIGLNQMIIQASDGDAAELQKALQGIQALRGILGSVLLFLIARPMAEFLGQGEITWAYQVLALVPILTGFAHFDVFRQQRRMRYGPFILTQLVPPVISVLLIWPLERVFGDWQVMLWSIMAQWTANLVLTHLVAERRYAIGFDRKVLKRGIAFGWPLLVNGVMLFVIYQGERMVVGRELGMADLAIFSMTLSLVQTPMGAVIRAVQQFLLPQIAAVKDDDARFGAMAAVTVQASGFAMAVMVAGVFLVGPSLVVLALGERYRPVNDLLLMMATVELIRSVRAGLSQVALARAKTGNGPLSNIPRVAAIGLSWYLLIHGAGLSTVLVVALCGETAGFAVALLLARRFAGMALAPVRLGIATLALLVAALVAASPQSGLDLPMAVSGSAVGASFAVFAVSLRHLWSYLRARRMNAYDDPA